MTYIAVPLGTITLKIVVCHRYRFFRMEIVYSMRSCTYKKSPVPTPRRSPQSESYYKFLFCRWEMRCSMFIIFTIRCANPTICFGSFHLFASHTVRRPPTADTQKESIEVQLKNSTNQKGGKSGVRIFVNHWHHDCDSIACPMWAIGSGGIFTFPCWPILNVTA